MDLKEERHSQRVQAQAQRDELRIQHAKQNAATAKSLMPLFPRPVPCQQDTTGQRISGIFGDLRQIARSARSLPLEGRIPTPLGESAEDAEVREDEGRMRQRQQQHHQRPHSRTTHQIGHKLHQTNGYSVNGHDKSEKEDVERPSDASLFGNASSWGSVGRSSALLLAKAAATSVPEKDGGSWSDGPSDVDLQQIIREMRDISSMSMITPACSPATRSQSSPSARPPVPGINTFNDEDAIRTLKGDLHFSESEDDKSSSSSEEGEILAPPTTTMPSDISTTEPDKNAAMAIPSPHSEDEVGWNLSHLLVPEKNLSAHSAKQASPSSLTNSLPKEDVLKEVDSRKSKEKASIDSPSRLVAIPLAGPPEKKRMRESRSAASLSPLAAALFPSPPPMEERAARKHIRLPFRARTSPVERSLWTVQFALDVIDRLPSSRMHNMQAPINQVASMAKAKKSKTVHTEERARRQNAGPDIVVPIPASSPKRYRTPDPQSVSAKSPLLDLDSASSVTDSAEGVKKSLKLRLPFKKKDTSPITAPVFQKEPHSSTASPAPIMVRDSAVAKAHVQAVNETSLEKTDKKSRESEKESLANDPRKSKTTKSEDGKTSRKVESLVEDMPESRDQVAVMITGPPLSPISSMSPTPITHPPPPTRTKVRKVLTDVSRSELSHQISKKRASSPDVLLKSSKKAKTLVKSASSRSEGSSKRDDTKRSAKRSTPPKRLAADADVIVSAKNGKATEEKEAGGRGLGVEEDWKGTWSPLLTDGEVMERRKSAVLPSKDKVTIVYPKKTSMTTGTVLDSILAGGNKNARKENEKLANGITKGKEKETMALTQITPSDTLLKVTPPTGSSGAKSLEDLWKETLANLSPLDTKLEFDHQRSLARGYKREAERIDRPGTRFAVYLQSVVHFTMMARSVEILRQRGVSDLYISTIAMMDTSKRSWNQKEPMTLLDKVARYLYHCAHALLDVKVYSLNEDKCIKMGKLCDYLRKQGPLLAAATSTGTPSVTVTTTSSTRPSLANGKSPSPGTSTASPYSVGSTGSHGSGEKPTLPVPSAGESGATPDRQSREPPPPALLPTLLEYHQMSCWLTTAFSHWNRSRSLLQSDSDVQLRQFQTWLQSKAPLYFTSTVEELTLHLYYALWVLRALKDSS